MTKKKIGVLNGKPVIQGDPNLITKNEILYKNDNNTIQLQERQGNELKSLTNSSSEDEENEYYKVKFNSNSEGYEILDFLFETSLHYSVISYIQDGMCIAPHLMGDEQLRNLGGLTMMCLRLSTNLCFEFSTKKTISNAFFLTGSSIDFKTMTIPAGSLYDKARFMTEAANLGKFPYKSEEEFLYQNHLEKISKEEYMAKIDHYYDSTIDDLTVSQT